MPTWYKTMIRQLYAQQANVFLLTGNVHDHIEAPQNSLVRYLTHMTEASVLAALQKEIDTAAWTQAQKERAIAETVLVAAYNINHGLQFSTQAQADEFNKHVPRAAAADPFGNTDPRPEGPEEAFARVDEYLIKTTQEHLATLVFLLPRAEILFGAADPILPFDRGLLWMVRDWADGSALVTAHNRHRVLLIAPSAEAVYPTLTAGRVSVLNLPLPDRATRRSFIDQVVEAEQPNVVFEEGMDPDRLSTFTGGLTLAAIEDVLYNDPADDGTLNVRRQAVQQRKDELVRQLYGGVMQIEYPTLGFDDIVGFEAIKDYMVQYVQPRLLDKDPICPKGIIFSGPPGCAKTALARAFAHAMGLPLVLVQIQQIKSKYVGSSNRNLARLQEGLKGLAPCLVLFDEIDKLFGGDDDSSGVTQELMASLQTFLSDLARGEMFVIATTNYPSRIDPALRRPGRLETLIGLFPEHLDGRRGQVLSSLARRMGLQHTLTDREFEVIGAAADGFSGADLELLVSEANVSCAMEEGATPESKVESRHFLWALDLIVPTAEGTQDMVDDTLRLTTNRRFCPPALHDRYDQLQKALRRPRTTEESVARTMGNTGKRRVGA